jgi:acetolactate synthase-1/3 small subunit
MIKDYLICVEADRELNYLYKVLMVFTRRRVETIHINAYRVDALSVARFNIKFRADAKMARNLSKQLNRQIDIIKADVYLWEAIEYHELGVYSLHKSEQHKSNTLREIAEEYDATFREMEEVYVIEKVGLRKDLEYLREILSTHHLLDFGYSGFAGVLNSKVHKEIYI